MEFEFDREKSKANKLKHGIDFIQAQSLWDDSNRLEVPARVRDEPRRLIIGVLHHKHWTAVITLRGEKVRIISVRRSREEEIELYES